jgi:GGDEF domain-containing protein
MKIQGSFGVASFPDDALQPNELIAKADEAMYLVKQTGRNGVRAAESSETGGAND